MEASIIKRYAPSLLPLLVLIGGVFTASGDTTASVLTDWRTLTQIGILLVTTGAAYVLPLLPSGWAGAWKVGAPIVGVILSTLLLVVTPGMHVTAANVILVITAVLKAVATQIGVSIRTDPVKLIDAGTVTAGTASTITSVVGANDALIDGDGLSDPANTDVPKHVAS